MMLESFIKNKNYIDEKGRSKSSLYVSHSIWKQAHELFFTLQIGYEFHLRIQAVDLTLSNFIFYYNYLIESLTRNCEKYELCRLFKNKIEKRCKDLITSPIYKCAYFLDPRFKKSFREDEISLIKSQLTRYKDDHSD